MSLDFDASFRRTRMAIFVIATITVVCGLIGIAGLGYLANELHQHLRCVP